MRSGPGEPQARRFPSRPSSPRAAPRCAKSTSGSPCSPGFMRALLLLLIAASAQAEDVSGRVFEQAGAGRVPSEGAYAIVHWIGYRPGFGHYESVCLQAAIGRTDATGRFTIPEPPMRSRFVLFQNDPAIAVYKPGFDAAREVRPRESREWSLVPTQMSREQ